MDQLFPEISKTLDSKEVNWTSIDVVKIGYDWGDRPVILWIGVKPSSLSGEKGVEVALACKELLVKYGINDVECEIRESQYMRLVLDTTEEGKRKEGKKRKGGKTKKGLTPNNFKKPSEFF